MKKNHTKIVVILDRSGSMVNIWKDTVGGFNTFIAEQKKQPGTADLTLIAFDTSYDVVIRSQDLSAVGQVDLSKYGPRGGTALVDAIGKTIDAVGNELSALKESDRPDKVLVCIVTDGEENSSKVYITSQYTTTSNPFYSDRSMFGPGCMINPYPKPHIVADDIFARVRDMITHQTDVYNWEFCYLGVGVDAFATTRNIYIGAANTANHENTSGGIKLAFTSLSANTTKYRSEGYTKGTFFEDEKQITK